MNSLRGHNQAQGERVNRHPRTERPYKLGKASNNRWKGRERTLLILFLYYSQAARRTDRVELLEDYQGARCLKTWRS